MLPSSRLHDIALAAADGQALDWAALESLADTPQHRQVISHLRLIANLGTVLREDTGGDSVPITSAAVDAPRGLQRWLHLELHEVIGRGAYGTVYKAWDARLQRHVALKLLVDLDDAAGAESEVIEEGRLLARVRHPHVVSVYGADRADGCVGLWMELISGVTLEQLVRERGTFGAREAAMAGIDLCRALAAVAASGLVHRDIKAHNVMREEGGRLVLMDFGAGHEQATLDRRITGTPLYMAPEALAGGVATISSDIYSLGVLLFFLATSQYPYKAQSLDELREAHRSLRRQRLSDLRPDLPRRFVSAVEKALAATPDERPESPASFEALLAEAVELSAPANKGRAIAIVPVLAVAALAFVGWRVARQEPAPTPADFHIATPRHLTTAEGWESDPAISPDGATVAFTSNQSGNPDVWVVDSRGGEPMRLTSSDGVERSPGWFPDGATIFYVADKSGVPSVWKMPRLGGSATAIVDNADEPAVSPDGKELAFTRRNADGNLRIAVASLADPTQMRIITTDDDGLWYHESPAWSPDGQWICYAAARDIWIVPTHGGRARRLTEDNEFDREPVFGDGGRTVYFSSLRAGTRAIWQVDASGGPASRVTNGAGPESHPRVSHDGKRLVYTTFAQDWDIALLNRRRGSVALIRTVRDEVLPTLSSDGSQVAFLTNKGGTATELWVQQLRDGVSSGEPRRLTDYGVSQPTFSPDGRWIAFHRAWNGARDIWAIPTSGGVATRVTDDPAADIHPSWSPDGKQIAFISERGGGSHVWIVGVHDGQPVGAPTQITSTLRLDLWPSWLGDGSGILFIGQQGQEPPEAWLATRDGTERRLTTGANARRTQWDPSTRSVLVSGTFADGIYRLWSVGLRNSPPVRFLPDVTFGVGSSYADFSVSADGRFVAAGREHGEGDVWLLEQP